MKKLIVNLFCLLLFFLAHAQMPTKGLAGYWPFNGNPSDMSGNGRNGIVNGAILCNDRFGNPNSAYLMDGINDHIYIANSTIVTGKALTVSVWAKADPSKQYGSLVITGNQNDYSIEYLPGDSAGFGVNFTYGSGGGFHCKSHNFIDNGWNLYVLTFNGTIVKGYINAELCDSIKLEGSIGTTPQPDWLSFGCYYLSGSPYSSYFKGAIDDIRIYSSTLNESEILALYGEGSNTLVVSEIQSNKVNSDEKQITPKSKTDSAGYRNSKNSKTRSVHISGTPDGVFVKYKFGKRDSVIYKSPCLFTISHVNKKQTITIYANDYEPQTFKIKKKIRWGWFAADVVSSVILLGVPLIVDFATGHVFKVEPEIIYQLKHTQEFCKREYRKIEFSNNVTVFKDYIVKYPESNQLSIAQVKIDSLEFITAINQRSEIAFEMYVESHPNSKFNNDAKVRQQQMAEARTTYEKACLENSVKAYKDYLNKYPNSIYDRDARIKLIDVGEIDAFNALSPDTFAYFYNEILMIWAPDREYKTQRSESVLKKLQNKIISETMLQGQSSYENLSKLWKRTVEFESALGQYFYLTSIHDTYAPKIFNAVFEKLKATTSKETQKECYLKSIEDFPNLIYTNRTLNNSIVYVLSQANYKNGKIVLFQNSYLLNYVNSKNNNMVNNEIEFTLQTNKNNYEAIYGASGNNVTDSKYSEELYFSNNLPSGTQNAYSGKTPLFQVNYSNGLIHGKSVFYENGKVRKEIYCNNGAVEYYYEFKNGVNVSLQQLSQKIAAGDKAFYAKNYSEALRIYQSECRNAYPETVAENVRIKAAIDKTNKAIADAKLAENTFNGKLNIKDHNSCYSYLTSNTFKIYGYNGGVNGPNYVTYEFQILDGLQYGDKLSAIEINYCPDCATVQTVTYCGADLSWNNNSNILTIILNGAFFKSIGLYDYIDMVMYLLPDGRLLHCYLDDSGNCVNKPNYSLKCIVIPK